MLKLPAKPRYSAKRLDGTDLVKGDQIPSFRGELWIYDGTTHPRKISVHRDEDPNGEPTWPNRENRQFYASVFSVGIWDNEYQEWSFQHEDR